jgi:hypothetical protein
MIITFIIGLSILTLIGMIYCKYKELSNSSNSNEKIVSYSLEDKDLELLIQILLTNPILWTKEELVIKKELLNQHDRNLLHSLYVKGTRNYSYNSCFGRSASPIIIYSNLIDKISELTNDVFTIIYQTQLGNNTIAISNQDGYSLSIDNKSILNADFLSNLYEKAKLEYANTQAKIVLSQPKTNISKSIIDSLLMEEINIKV